MAKYRSKLPQLDRDVFLTDGGIETTLIFDDGIDLPYFAAFHLLADGAGKDALERYFDTYGSLARRDGVGIVLETPTWRANPDWASKVGYSPDELAEVNRRSVALLEEIRERYETLESPIVISGCLGPRGDGYDPSNKMRVDEARDYHSSQLHLPGHRSRPGDGDNHELRRGGNRHCGRGQRRRHAGGHLFHS